ncbi:MAG: hypothetical protein EA412_00150 [Chitinophagaceae bacterium]|nr:MAG: hypothetical protein EA412_00150 [Chitinophagaceae bacterium]
MKSKPIKEKIYLLIPIVLCMVFANQFLLVKTQNLTQWKGGGFGMFSTIDKHSERVIRIYLKQDSLKIPVIFPFGEKFNELHEKTIYLPNNRNLKALHEYLNGYNWKCEQSLTESIANDCIAVNPVNIKDIEILFTDFNSIVIQIDRLNLDKTNNSISAKTITRKIFN